MAAFDVNIQIVPASRYTGMGFYSFGQVRSLGVRGIQKLLNIAAKHLLTPIGTDPLDPDYGTSVPGLIGSNVALADAQEILDIGVDRTIAYVQRWQAGRASVADDERLATMAVSDYLEIPEGPGFSARIAIANAASQQLQIVLPTLEVRSRR